MTNLKSIRWSVIVILHIITFIQPALAEFRPEEVAVIVNTQSDEGKNLASFYTELRKIPRSNIINISTAPSYSISRRQFEKDILTPIKHALSESSLKRIKVLVTTYDVPLKVNEIEKSNQNLAVKEELAGLLKTAINDFQNICKQIDATTTQLKLSTPLLLEKKDIKTQEVLTSLSSLWSHINSSNSENKEALRSSIQELITKTVGTINPITFQPDPKTKKIAESGKKALDTIDPLSDDFSIKDLHEISKTSSTLFGLTGQISTFKSIFDRLFGEQTSASVDSELTFTLLQNVLPISSRLPNPFFVEHDKAQIVSDPVLLVSRLDGPNIEIIKKNILHGIKIEKSGVEPGNFLIDSRGSSFDDRTELATWDRKLTTLARGTFGEKIEVEFDNSQELADDTQNIMFYLGWYSVRNYKNAYSFIPGAIGYHIASEEAVNLHDAQEKGWCKNLLERGVVTTVGAVEEPYLDSFPYPEYFFPLIRTGAYQIVEIYYMTTKYLSWRQVLFSDPLYNPYKSKKDSLPVEEVGFAVMPPLSTRLVNR